MAFHRNIDGPTDGHVIHSLSYADAAARTGATGLTAADVGRVALQADNATFWVLTAHSPVTWLSVVGSAGSDTSAIHVNASGEINGVTAKTTPAAGDVFLVEDSAAAFVKKKVSASALVLTGDTRLSDARTPTAHASSHNAGGGDALAIDAVAGTGSLRTLGTAATAACAGNDARLSNARTDTDAIHKSTAGEIAALTRKASPVAADLLVIEDSAEADAKKKITVGSIPLAYSEVESSSTTSTTSGTDVLMSGMTLTPAAGEYLCWFSGEVDHSQDANLTMSIYVDGVRENASQREVDISDERNACFACTNHAVVNGSQAIEGRWRTSTSTASCYRRQLYLLKIK
jgi:hypothetical protein